MITFYNNMIRTPNFEGSFLSFLSNPSMTAYKEKKYGSNIFSKNYICVPNFIKIRDSHFGEHNKSTKRMLPRLDQVNIKEKRSEECLTKIQTRPRFRVF
mgnify:CR=1 FL=1